MDGGNISWMSWWEMKLYLKDELFTMDINTQVCDQIKLEINNKMNAMQPLVTCSNCHKFFSKKIYLSLNSIGLRFPL